MVRKSIMIKENPYNFLKSMKDEKGSFSDVLESFNSRRSLR
ncbi:MAG: antitoxin VapB family protein [Candidatus Magasanikbacteria bacterium]